MDHQEEMEIPAQLGLPDCRDPECGLTFPLEPQVAVDFLSSPSLQGQKGDQGTPGQPGQKGEQGEPGQSVRIPTYM